MINFTVHLSAAVLFFVSLFSLQPPCTSPNDGMWLGLTNIATGTNYIWETTQISGTYTNWSATMPDNYGGLQHCVHMWCLNNNGEWDDDYCYDGGQSTLCEVIIPCSGRTSEFSWLTHKTTKPNISYVIK
jgi:hypothetical protein